MTEEAAAVPTGPVDTYAVHAEQEIRRLRDKLGDVARVAGRLQSVLRHSRDNTPTVDEVRGIATDLYDALGIIE